MPAPSLERRAGDVSTAPWWLPGGHLQTIVPARFCHVPQVAFARERLESVGADGQPDGDFIDVDWIADASGTPAFDADRPLVIMFHGLEGSSQSHYAQALMHAVAACGWNGCVPHFRGCSGEENRLPRAYHSGDADEIDWILKRIVSARRPRAVYAVGISLGGNALMKWAGREGSAAATILRAAAAVSAPLDLAAAGLALGRGFNMVYTRMFLATLKEKSLAKEKRFPGMLDRERVARARDLYEFDNLVTAPLHGFRDTDDYWSRASAKRSLIDVRVPSLVLNARNDPFLPAHALPRLQEVAGCVTLEQPAAGGHVGFASGAWPPGRIHALPQRLLDYFRKHP
ncbi:MAG: alpha/beta fold hydrolase [Burkholderiales bacterium]|nr:alpha/beta fold hydrolase [Burkholderiales bacterium]